jgi:HPt (histidine-containing phosphotransfer) domain-containing protein
VTLKELAERIGVDKTVVESLVRDFIKTSRTDIENLQAAVDEGDTAGAAQFAHSIKGAAVNLELDSLSSPASILEGKARQGSLEGAPQILMGLSRELTRVSQEMLGGE